MKRTSRQLKDLIRNMAREKRAEAHILMRNHMMARLLERVSLSACKDRLILKGGMLVAAMVGLDPWPWAPCADYGPWQTKRTHPNGRCAHLPFVLFSDRRQPR